MAFLSEFVSQILPGKRCLEALLGSVSSSIEQSIAILFCLERRWQILHSVPPGMLCSLAMPVYLIRVIMLEDFVQGTCLVYVKNVLFLFH